MSEHPIRKGAILRLTSESENVEPVLSIEQRLRDIDDGHYWYELCCPTLTGYYSYRQEEVDDLFEDTGITHDGVKPIDNDEIRDLYQDLCEHSWNAVHDPETLVPDGFVCSGCQIRLETLDESTLQALSDDGQHADQPNGGVIQ